ncbi:MAG: hypothetical protein KF690_11040 [Bacteroidetes bacterium]|nr:hypothetical protein [Bacteroidota bacterium]
MQDFLYQSIKITVPSAGIAVKYETESLKLGKRIVGIALVQSRLALTAELGLLINGKEIFPDTMPVPLLVALPFTETERRFIPLDEPAEGNKITGLYTDLSPALGFTAYEVNLTFKLTR